MCSKVAYTSLRSAKAGLNGARQAAKRAKGNRKLPIRVYVCDSCGRYHLTSLTERERRLA